MPELPIKEVIMGAIKARLESIDDSEASYWTTSVEVRRSRDTMPDNSPSGTIFLFEGEDEKTDSNNPCFMDCRFPVGVVYHWEEYNDKPGMGNKLLSDITTAMGVEYRYTTPSGKTSVAYIREVTSEVMTDEGGGPAMMATTIFKVEYRHVVGDQTELP